MEGHAYAAQRCERLVDGDGTYIEHGARHGIAACNVFNESASVHVLHVTVECVETAYGIDTLVYMSQIEALEVFLEERQLAQSAVCE